MTLNIIDEIESLVSDQLQVVSYKWLSRNFSLSSDSAKRLLKDFVEKHEKDLEVVYTVSGWLKKSSSNYHTKLVSSSKLSEVEKEFDGTYSVHIYSVQASIPTDPAAIWNAEFVQAEEFFKQPSATNNCLRDNRFCGISNSSVKRNVEGATESPSGQGSIFKKSTLKVSHQAKSETHIAPARNQSVKPSSDKEKPLPAFKKNGQGEKSAAVTGGSLKNMWGRVPVKTEDDSAKAEVKNHDHSEAQKPDEADVKGGGDDESGDFEFRRSSRNNNRKRKVIFDLSDEECEDVISLVSPSSPKFDSHPGSKDSDPEKPDARGDIKTDEPELSKEDEPKTASAVRKNEKPMAPPTEKIQPVGLEAEENPSKGRKSPDAPNLPKMKKVMKTRIDDRGREVTEVVWEETETSTKKKDETETSKKLNDSNKSGNAVSNRAVAEKKSPAIGNAAATNGGGKAGGKKGGGNGKDPKQGNIMSFFKKV